MRLILFALFLAADEAKKAQEAVLKVKQGSGPISRRS